MPYPTTPYDRVAPVRGSVPVATTGVGAYGGIPQLPDPTSTAAGAIAGNIDNLDAIRALGAGVTDIGNQNARAGYLANLPNYAAMTGTASGNALSNLHGIIPPDVIAQLMQSGAERGVAMGGIDSPNANAATLRALGLTSLDLMNNGLNQFNTLYHDTPLGPQFNPASMLVTPDQEQSAAAMQGIYNAAPNPDAAAAAALHNAQLGIGAGGGSGGVTFAPPGGASGIRTPTKPEPPGTMVGNSTATDYAWKQGGTNGPNKTGTGTGAGALSGGLTGGRAGSGLDTGTGALSGGKNGANAGSLVGGTLGPGQTGGRSGSATNPAFWYNSSKPWEDLSGANWLDPNMGFGSGQDNSGTGGSQGNGMVTPGTDLYLQLQDLGIPDAELWSVEDARWLLGDDSGNDVTYGDGYYTMPGEQNQNYFEDLGNQMNQIDDVGTFTGLTQEEYDDLFGDSGNQTNDTNEAALFPGEEPDEETYYYED